LAVSDNYWKSGEQSTAFAAATSNCNHAIGVDVNRFVHSTYLPEKINEPKLQQQQMEQYMELKEKRCLTLLYEDINTAHT
jgi:hypothetical protein